MGIGKKLLVLLKQNKCNVHELSQNIGVSSQTLYSIVRRDNMKADFDVLFRISEYFGVKPEYFYSADDSLQLLSEEKQELINLYIRLNKYGKKRLLETAHEYTMLAKYTSNRNNLK